jgi:TPR repeat protein
LFRFEKSAELGDVYGQFNTGLIYHNGIGVEVNYEKAFNW